MNPKNSNPVIRFVKRKIFAVARRTIPSIKKQYHLDTLVGPIGYWKELEKYQLKCLIARGLMPHHTLLDIGCGPLQGGIPFIKYLKKGHYVGLDLRQKPLRTGYRRIAENNLVDKNPTLILSDSFGKHELKDLKFDFIWSSQMLYHLCEKKLSSLLNQISRLSHPETVFLSDIIGHPNRVTPESHWGGFSFHLHNLEEISQIAARHGLEVQDVGPISEYGYPMEIALHTNRLLEFRLTNLEKTE